MNDSAAYRCGPKLFWQGMTCTVLFALIGIGSFAVAYWNIDGSFDKPHSWAFFFLIFWSCWTLLGVWMLLYAVRARLRFTEETLEQTGCFRTRTIDWRDLSRARWRIIPQSGSVALQTAKRRITVEFGLFDPRQRPEIIQQLRTRIPESAHENWDKFQRRWLIPGTNRPEWSPRARPVVRGLLLGFALLFGVLWAMGSGVAYLVLAIANAVVAVSAIRKRPT